MSDIAFLPNHTVYDDGNRFDDLMYWCREGSVEEWTCKKTAADGDLYLFYFGSPKFVVTALGVSDGRIREEKNRGQLDWTTKPREWSCAFDPLFALKHPVNRRMIESLPVLRRWWDGMPWKGGAKSIRREYALPLLELIRNQNSRDRRLQRLLDPYLQDLRTRPGGRPKHRELAGEPTGARTRQLAIDKDEPPERKVTSTLRIVRDTALGRGLKRLYKHRCQICGRTIAVPPSIGDGYSEVHHVRPLGGAHLGIDHWPNMLVLCPMCHAEMDLLAIAVGPKTHKIHSFGPKHPYKGRRLRLDKRHHLDVKNLRYHWRLFQDHKPA